ncbi:lipase family protein [Legionella londiniensis]|uniref:lipase family protein n=1 Tax=Legionella londiniensis TaxID=45068 RepID=UPI00399CAA3B
MKWTERKETMLFFNLQKKQQPQSEQGLDFLKTCATLSLLVYHDKLAPDLPPDLEKINVASSNQCYAEAYIHKPSLSQKIALVFVAYRGTDKFSDLISDVYLLFKTVPADFKHHAIPFMQNFSQELEKKYPDFELQFMFTGHSLGAAFAELSKCWMASRAKAITFDSPGIKDLAEILIDEGILQANDVLEQDSDIKSYLSKEVNAVNSCNGHIGILSGCDIPYQFDWSLLYPKTPFFPLPSYFLLNFTLGNQHKMTGFYQYIMDGRATCAIKNWPENPLKGYLHYLNYDNHPEYWGKYMQQFWARFEARLLFFFNFNFYKTVFLCLLNIFSKRIHKEMLVEKDIGSAEKMINETLDQFTLAICSDDIKQIQTFFEKEYQLNHIEKNDYEEIQKFFSIYLDKKEGGLIKENLLSKNSSFNLKQVLFNTVTNQENQFKEPESSQEDESSRKNSRIY